MLAEDQARASQFDVSDQYYSEDNLPGEDEQIEMIRRMRHNEVAAEAEETLAMLAQINMAK